MHSLSNSYLLSVPLWNNIKKRKGEKRRNCIFVYCLYSVEHCLDSSMISSNAKSWGILAARMKKACFPGFIYEYYRTSLICTYAREDTGNDRVNEHFVDQNFINSYSNCHLFPFICSNTSLYCCCYLSWYCCHLRKSSFE